MKEKSQGRMRVGRVGEALLLSVAAVGVVSIAILAPNALQILQPFFKKKKYSPKQAITRNIDSLVRSGLLKKSVGTDGTITLELTKRGVWESLLRGHKEVKKMKWDGLWRVVIFDVPMAKRYMRNELRRGISLYGFHQLQQSVWVYPYPCDDFIKLLKEHLELSGDILIMEAKHIEGDKELKREFGIR